MFPFVYLMIEPYQLTTTLYIGFSIGKKKSPPKLGRDYSSIIYFSFRASQIPLVGLPKASPLGHQIRTHQ